MLVPEEGDAKGRAGWSEVGESHSIALILVLLLVDGLHYYYYYEWLCYHMQTFTGLLEVKGTRVPFWKLMLPLVKEVRRPEVAELHGDP